MKVKLDRPLHAVRPGEVYPVMIPAGEIVEGRLAEIAIEQKKGSLQHEGSVTSVNTPAPNVSNSALAANGAGASPPPSATRARVKKAYAGPDETGEPCKLAKGAVVEGAFADTLIASGFATAI